MKNFFIITLLTLSATSNAYADQASSFEGSYVGIDLSYSISGDEKGYETNGDGEPITYTLSQEIKGDFSWGLKAGYNLFLSENILLGFDVSYHKFNDKDHNTTWLLRGQADNDYPSTAKLDDRADLKAKLGYVFNNADSLIYVTSGFSRLNMEHIEVSDNFVGTGNLKSTHNGWIVGLGGEHFISNQLSMNLEYLYTNYSNECVDSSFLYDPGDKDCYEIDDGSLRLGLNYWF